MAETDGTVIKLMTAPERDAAELAAFKLEVNAECIKILERALQLARDRPMAGVAVSFVFDDGFYGRIIPEHEGGAAMTSNMAGLIGAAGTTHHDLILSTLAT